MFFRREKPPQYTFSQRLSMLREAGFKVEERESNRALVRREACAALVEDTPSGPSIGKTGMVFASELARLTSLGYQTVWTTPSGRRLATTAEHLESFHTFLEDLRAKLGLTSLYNESLGTTHADHHYDRVAGRE